MFDTDSKEQEEIVECDGFVELHLFEFSTETC